MLATVVAPPRKSAMADPAEYAAACAQAASMPLADIDVSDPGLHQRDVAWPYLARLRRDAPVHHCAQSPFGPYWSVTRYRDVQAVDTNHRVFSSEASLGGITLRDQPEDFRLPMFIAMDNPKHDAQRRVVNPIVATGSLAHFEHLIRGRVGEILDGLPRNETFDWVDRVAIEQTTQMLATLFDFPWQERRRLTRWSDVATAVPGTGIVETQAQRQAELLECLQYFTRLWNERVAAPEPGSDLISLLAQNPATRDMPPMEYLGNVVLLIVGGNDTTRNSITGGLLALHGNPDEYAKLRADPALIEPAVQEMIRWQSPIAHMRRTALADAELGGQHIRKGDKVVMWYMSANRDETVIEDPEAFVIDRARPRTHLAFGIGIHRCMGSRLAELQLRVLWEEILRRRLDIDVVGDPRRVYSNFIRGIASLPVRIRA
jgi:cytochrome P450